jgi:hypothetical protein
MRSLKIYSLVQQEVVKDSILRKINNQGCLKLTENEAKVNIIFQ